MESEKKNIEDPCWVNEKTPSRLSKNSTENCVFSFQFEDLCSVIYKMQAHTT